MIALVLLVVGVALAGPPSWESTLDRVVDAVVSIRVSGVRDFDTEQASSSQGTGFVVDAERGILLTNRHMVHAGPVVAQALFNDSEEVDLRAIYRDPVHDFGFYQFDPSALKHMALVALPLAPEAARVGLDIRVVGNDSGEKLSILDGTLSRLRRAAPFYGSDKYNDFNTFYLQAASNTSGGSSGSPVVDIAGQVVALNAGGKTRAASSFYLPLDRVVRALASIQAGQPVVRGTLQATFAYTHFDELRRLGLSDASQQQVRAAFPDSTGMLRVESVVPRGPAAGHLETGDIVVRLDGELVDGFAPLEARLDASVGGAVSFEIERGGVSRTIKVSVQNLHAITPREFLELGRGVLHNLSYQQARNHHIPVWGVYLADNGYMWSRAGVPSRVILTHIDGQAVPDLDAAQAILAKTWDLQPIRVRFHSVNDPRHAKEAVVKVDRRWNPMRRCVRDDHSGRWPCVEIGPAPAPPPVTPPAALPALEGDGPARVLAPSLVLVDFDVPFSSAAVKDTNYVGVGTVIDAERGLVLVDRDTVPVALGDIEITFAGTVRVPAQLVTLHPLHNFAVIHYDPQLLGDVPVQAVRFAERPLEVGDRVWQVGLTRALRLVSHPTHIKAVEALDMGLSRTPRFRDANIEGVLTDSAAPSLGGVLVDKKGRVVALWASFLDYTNDERTFYGIPDLFLRPTVDALRRGEQPVQRFIGAEFTPIRLADARERGVSDDRMMRLLDHDPRGRRALLVVRRMGGSAAFDALRDADILVAIDGSPVTRMSELEVLQQHAKLSLTVVRDGREKTVEIATEPLSGHGVDRVLSWAGLLLHDPHYEVMAQQGVADDGVYVAWEWYGSPGSRYRIRPTKRIVSVNGNAIHSLDDMIEAVSGLGDASVRLKLLTADGRRQVRSLKLDPEYWPTTLIELTAQGWIRRPVP